MLTKNVKNRDFLVYTQKPMYIKCGCNYLFNYLVAADVLNSESQSLFFDKIINFILFFLNEKFQTQMEISICLGEIQFIFFYF